MESWVFLLVGSVGAIGAAMVVGTLAALVGWYRTGEMPNQGGDGAAPSERTIRLLWARVAVGVVVAAGALVVLQQQGLL